MRLFTSISVLGLTAFTLLPCGCGGSDATLSKAEFVKQADAICRQAQEAELKVLRKYVRKHPETLHLQPEIEKDRKVLALARPLVRKEARQLSALPAPKGDEEKVAAIIAAIEAGTKKAHEDPLSTVTGTYREASALASKYGLSQCTGVS